MNSFIVVVGNTYNINNTLKIHGFKFLYDKKVWYKVASPSAAIHWEKHIGNKSISFGHVESLNKKCAQLGTFKQVWIPKSQIKRIVDLLNKPE